MMDPFSKRLLIENIFTIMGLSSVAIGVITLATRWLELHYKAKARTAAPLPAGDDARLVRIEAAVEAMAIEVERISEAQRFTTRLLAEAPARPLPPTTDAAMPARSAQ